MDLTQLPEKYLRINGFRHVRSNEFYVEWRRADEGDIERVWVDFVGDGWEVNGILEGRKSGSVLNQDHIDYAATAEAAVESAYDWMKYDNGFQSR